VSLTGAPAQGTHIGRQLWMLYQRRVRARIAQHHLDRIDHLRRLLDVLRGAATVLMPTRLVSATRRNGLATCQCMANDLVLSNVASVKRAPAAANQRGGQVLHCTSTTAACWLARAEHANDQRTSMNSPSLPLPTRSSSSWMPNPSTPSKKFISGTRSHNRPLN